MGAVRLMGILALVALASPALAGLSISPFVSISSTKSVQPNRKESTEKETIKQRQTVGLRAALSFWSLMRTELSVGQNALTTTEKVSEITDEYGEIDFEKDADLATDNPDNEVKIIETQRRARFSFIFDPGFWIFIARAKVGVEARQRLLKVEEIGKAPVELTPSPSYSPLASVGFGVKLGYGTFAMMEYGFLYYKFPKTDVFERELSVSYGISL